MSGLRLHPRHAVVDKLRNQINKTICDAVDADDEMTFAEILAALSSESLHWANGLVQQVRTEEDPRDETDAG